MAGSSNTPEAKRPSSIRLGASDELVERGRAIAFDVLLWGRPARAFALRFDGRVVAYLNRCLHVPVEMEAVPGEFLDAERGAIVCSIHGAAYEPTTGRCVGGPCGRGALMAIAAVEQGGEVGWYPSLDIQPAPAPPFNPPRQPADSP